MSAVSSSTKAASATVAEPLPASAAASAPASGWRKWVAAGTGVGIEMGERDLQVAVVRVRPNGISVLGSATVKSYGTRPAAEWGTELSQFLGGLGVVHIATTVLLPRREVTVRQVHLPGVNGKDLASAIRLQLDTLHPYADEDVDFSYARIGKTPMVLVGIVRRSVTDRYLELLSEAGIKIGSFTFPAAALYSSMRVLSVPPAEFVTAIDAAEDGEIEVYGESPSRPVYTAALPIARERAVAVARSELRLEPEVEATSVARLLPAPVVFPESYNPENPVFESHVLAYASALTGACPWLGIDGNLLPSEKRQASSRARLIPTAALATTLVLLIVALSVQDQYHNSRYLDLLQHEINRYQPAAQRLRAVDRQIAATRARTQAIDDFRRRARLDLDSLREITRLVPPPGWLSSLDMDRTTVQLSGEAEQAAPLLESFDRSPLFRSTEFTMPISRSTNSEVFRIRSQREQAPATPGAAPPPARPNPAAPAPEAKQ
jgi:Tfp pilus assembly protein PilN